MNEGIEDWYEEIMLPEKQTKLSQFQKQSVKSVDGSEPMRHEKALIMTYPQFKSGLCGLCSLASALSYNYGEEMGAYLYKFRDQYY